MSKYVAQTPLPVLQEDIRSIPTLDDKITNELQDIENNAHSFAFEATLGPRKPDAVSANPPPFLTGFVGALIKKNINLFQKYMYKVIINPDDSADDEISKSITPEIKKMMTKLDYFDATKKTVEKIDEDYRLEIPSINEDTIMRIMIDPENKGKDVNTIKGMVNNVQQYIVKVNTAMESNKEIMGYISTIMFLKSINKYPQSSNLENYILMPEFFRTEDINVITAQFDTDIFKDISWFKKDDSTFRKLFCLMMFVSRNATTDVDVETTSVNGNLAQELYTYFSKIDAFLSQRRKKKVPIENTDIDKIMIEQIYGFLQNTADDISHVTKKISTKIREIYVTFIREKMDKKEYFPRLLTNKKSSWRNDSNLIYLIYLRGFINARWFNPFKKGYSDYNKRLQFNAVDETILGVESLQETSNTNARNTRSISSSRSRSSSSSSNTSVSSVSWQSSTDSEINPMRIDSDDSDDSDDTSFLNDRIPPPPTCRTKKSYDAATNADKICSLMVYYEKNNENINNSLIYYTNRYNLSNFIDIPNLYPMKIDETFICFLLSILDPTRKIEFVYSESDETKIETHLKTKLNVVSILQTMYDNCINDTSDKEDIKILSQLSENEVKDSINEIADHVVENIGNQTQENKMKGSNAFLYILFVAYFWKNTFKGISGGAGGISDVKPFFNEYIISIQMLYTKSSQLIKEMVNEEKHIDFQPNTIIQFVQQRIERLKKQLQSIKIKTKDTNGLVLIDSLLKKTEECIRVYQQKKITEKTFVRNNDYIMRPILNLLSKIVTRKEDLYADKISIDNPIGNLGDKLAELFMKEIDTVEENDGNVINPDVENGVNQLLQEMKKVATNMGLKIIVSTSNANEGMELTPLGSDTKDTTEIIGGGIVDNMIKIIKPGTFIGDAKKNKASDKDSEPYRDIVTQLVTFFSRKIIEMRRIQIVTRSFITKQESEHKKYANLMIAMVSAQRRFFASALNDLLLCLSGMTPEVQKLSEMIPNILDLDKPAVIALLKIFKESDPALVTARGQIKKWEQTNNLTAFNVAQKKEEKQDLQEQPTTLKITEDDVIKRIQEWILDEKILRTPVSYLFSRYSDAERARLIRDKEICIQVSKVIMDMKKYPINDISLLPSIYVKEDPVKKQKLAEIFLNGPRILSEAQAKREAFFNSNQPTYDIGKLPEYSSNQTGGITKKRSLVIAKRRNTRKARLQKNGSVVFVKR